MAESFSTSASAPSAPSKVESYKVADKRTDGTVVLEQEDGSMFVAKVNDGTDVRRGSRVTIKSDGVDEGNAPVNAVVEKVL